MNMRACIRMNICACVYGYACVHTYEYACVRWTLIGQLRARSRSAFCQSTIDPTIPYTTRSLPVCGMFLSFSAVFAGRNCCRTQQSHRQSVFSPTAWPHLFSGAQRVERGRRATSQGRRARSLLSTRTFCMSSSQEDQPKSKSMASLRPKVCVLGGGFGGLYTALRLCQLPWGRDLRRYEAAARTPQRESTFSVDNSERRRASDTSKQSASQRLVAGQRTRPELTLIDTRERFVFLPLLYELVTGEMGIWEVAPPFAELLEDTDVDFLQAQVQHIDLDKRQVTVRPMMPSNASESKESDEIISYDRLVIALGSEDTRDMVPGAREHALGFRSVEDAIRIRERVRLLESSSQPTIRIVIVGGGYSGVELACNLSDRLGPRAQIQIVDRGRELMAASTAYNRSQATRALRLRNISFVPETSVVSVGPNSLRLSHAEKSGDRAPPASETTLEQIDLVLWTAGNRINKVIREGLIASRQVERNERGQLLTDRFLRLPNYPEVIVLGDAAQIREPVAAVPVVTREQPRGMTAQIALQEADFAAWNTWASLTGREPLPFQYVHLGEMITLGRDDGSVQLLGLLNLSGPLAHQLRRLAYIARMPTDAHRLRVGASYVAQPLLRILEGVLAVGNDVLDALGQGRGTRAPGCPFTANQDTQQQQQRQQSWSSSTAPRSDESS